jgi:hypothetical protein
MAAFAKMKRRLTAVETTCKGGAMKWLPLSMLLRLQIVGCALCPTYAAAQEIPDRDWAGVVRPKEVKPAEQPSEAKEVRIGPARARVSGRKVVMTPQQRRDRKIGAWPDGSLGVSSQFGVMTTFGARNNGVARAMGSVADPWMGGRTAGISSGEKVPYKGGGPIFADPDSGNTYLFYHAERHPTGDKTLFYSWIGLALADSNDGRSFRDLGPILTPNVEMEMMDRSVEVGAGSFAVLGPYLYLYFRDLLADGKAVQLSVARAKISEVAKAAARGEAAPWTKFYRGEFQEPGLGGRSSPLEEKNRMVRWCAVAQSHELGLLVMALAAPNGTGTGIFLSTSQDGIVWSDPVLISEESGECFYPSLFSRGPVGWQFGRKLNLYYIQSHIGGFNRWDDAVLIWREIEFEERNDANPQESGAAQDSGS